MVGFWLKIFFISKKAKAWSTILFNQQDFLIIVTEWTKKIKGSRISSNVALWILHFEYCPVKGK
jgi:hypothetical protein